jgi:hypothetical protein
LQARNINDLRNGEPTFMNTSGQYLGLPSACWRFETFELADDGIDSVRPLHPRIWSGPCTACPTSKGARQPIMPCGFGYLRKIVCSRRDSMVAVQVGHKQRAAGGAPEAMQALFRRGARQPHSLSPVTSAGRNDKYPFAGGQAMNVITRRSLCRPDQTGCSELSGLPN